MTPCVHCGLPVTEPLPERWVKKYPEIKNLCLRCFNAWQYDHERGDNEIIHVGGLAANLEEKRILDGLMANLMKKKDGAA
jgi:hypothetical protein